MPRKHTAGPGPKSKKQKAKNFAFFGDSEASSAESFHSPDLEPNHTDYGFNYTSTSPRSSRRSKVTEPKSTRETAQAENSPRRSNTTRQNTPSSSEQVQQASRTSARNSTKSRTSEVSPQRRSVIPQNTPSSSEQVQQESRTSERSSRKSRQSEISPQRRSFIPQSTRNTPKAAPQSTRNTPKAAPVKKPRKQNNPRQRERMIWNQIRELQKRTDNITPKAPFGRLIRELLIQYSSDAHRITLKALEALQISSEIYLTQLFADAYVCTLHRGRVTLGLHDVRLVRFLRGPGDAGNF